MKTLPFRKINVFVGSLLLLLIPALLHAQSSQAQQDTPPVAAPLVREGDFAVQLASALGMGTTADEIAAETRLGEMGIAPRNGWIADYPVTPDILGELQKSVSDAADAQRIQMSKDEALQRVNELTLGLNAPVTPSTGDSAYKAAPPGAENYLDPTVIQNYYATEGPPIYTYYPPPPDYSYLYSYVPYPFWYSSFWFPGFFVLRDFHRTIYVHGRPFYCSNHFHDAGLHSFSRIDPGGRFHGKAASGMGTPSPRGFSNTEMPRALHPPPTRAGAPSPAGIARPSYRGAAMSQGYHGGIARTSSHGPIGSHSYRASSVAMASYRPSVSPSYRGGGASSRPSHNSGGFSGRGGGSSGRGVGHR